MTDQLLCYEHPLHERIRSALRLEFLFDEYHRLATDPGLRRPLIGVINDLLSLLTRADAWSDLGKDLQHEIDHLEGLRDNPEVDASRLTETLDPLQGALIALGQENPSAIQIPKLLLAVMQRATVPGGTAPADMPGYSFWLRRHPDEQERDLREWTRGLGTFELALRHYLSLVRQRGEWELAELNQGQCSLQMRQRYHLLRIAMPQEAPWYPEVSGGRQRLNIRLRAINAGEHNEAIFGVPELQLALCG